MGCVGRGRERDDVESGFADVGDVARADQEIAELGGPWVGGPGGGGGGDGLEVGAGGEG